MPVRRVLAASLTAALVAVIVIAVNWSPGRSDPPGGDNPAPPMVDNAGSTAPTVIGSQETSMEGTPREATAVPEATTIPEARMPTESAGTSKPDLSEAPAFARLLGQPIRSTETRIAIDDVQVAVAELPTTNSNVRIYQVRN